MPLDPEKQTLFDTFRNDITQKRWVDLALFALIFFGPSLWAAFQTFMANRKVEELYKLRLGDKDGVIAEQTARIKQLEDLTLRRPRK